MTYECKLASLALLCCWCSAIIYIEKLKLEKIIAEK